MHESVITWNGSASRTDPLNESVIVKHLLEYKTDPLKMHESVIYIYIYLLECIYQLAELYPLAKVSQSQYILFYTHRDKTKNTRVSEVYSEGTLTQLQ